MLKIYDIMFPNTTGVFFFDQSSAHQAFAPNALVAQNMNINPGGKQPALHSTRIPHHNPNPGLRGRVQSMVYGSDHPDHPDQPKGMEAVLKERGLYNQLDKGRGNKPVGVCVTCRLSETKCDQALKAAKERLEEDPEMFSSIGNFALEFYPHLHLIPSFQRMPPSQVRSKSSMRLISPEVAGVACGGASKQRMTSKMSGP